MLRGAITAKRPDVIKLLLTREHAAQIDSSILRDVIMTAENEYTLIASLPFTHNYNCVYFRDFAMLLVRYSKNDTDLMKQLRESGDMERKDVVLFHVLIKKMPGNNLEL